MYEFEITPFMLFLGLILVLLFSALCGNKSYYQIARNEGFIDYHMDTESLAEINLPGYPNTLNKIYDNLFFDQLSGNVVSLLGIFKSQKGNQEFNGTSISAVNVIDRNAIGTMYMNYNPAITKIDVSSSLLNSNISWDLYPTDPEYIKTSNTQIFYMAWNKETYIHIIDLNENVNVCTCLFNTDSASPFKKVYTDKNHKMIDHISLTTPNNSIEPSHNKLSGNIYQLSTNIFANIKTGSLELKNQSGTSNNIYDRTGNIITNELKTSYSVDKFSPWTFTDTTDQLMVLSIPYKYTTLISLFQISSNKKSYKCILTKRIDLNAVDGGSSLNPDTIYAKNYTPPEDAVVSHKYMLKSQCVPPVCPALPVYAAEVV
jgi:hypothetical protein